MTIVDQAEMLAVLLAYSATWQTLARASGDVDAAALLIHQVECDDEVPYPRATIARHALWGQAVGFGQTGGGGSLYLRLDLVPDETLETRAARDAWAFAQAATIKKEMEALSNGRTTPDGYDVSHLVVKKITLEALYEQLAMERPADDEQGGCNAVLLPWVAGLVVEF